MTKNSAVSADFNTSGLANRAVLAGRSVFAAKVVRHGASAVTYLLLVNILAPSDFGLLKMVTVILSAVNLLNDLGLSSAVVQRPELDESRLKGAVSVSLFSGILLYALVYFTAPLASLYFREPSVTAMLRIGALSVPLSAFSSVHRGVLQRRLSFGTLAIAEVAGALTGSCTAVAMAFSGWGVWSLIAHILIQPAITSIITILAGPRIWSGISGIKSAWPLVVFGLSVIVPRLVDYAGQSFDTWIIGRYFGSSSLGLFTVAYTAALLPMFFMSSVLLQIALSVFSRMQNNMKAMNRTFMKLSEFSALAAGAYFCILFVFTPEITMFLDSRRMSAPVWGPSVQFIRILIPMGFLYAVSSFYNITWLAMGMMKERMWIVVFNTASLAISVITGAFFSINGICIALSIRALIMYFVVITITMRKTGLDIFAYFGRILSVAAIGAAVVVAALWLRNTAAGMAGVRLSLYMPAGILIVLALYFTAVRLILPGIFKESLTLIGKFISFGRKTGF